MDTVTPEWQVAARDYISARYTATDTGCWEWALSCSDNGYGKAKFQQWQVGAHRLSYLAHVGQIPDSLHLDHLCRNRRCINPAHLEPVTPRENVRRGVYAHLGRNYSLCLTGRGLWQATCDSGGQPRRRHFFRSKVREEAQRKVEEFIANDVA